MDMATQASATEPKPGNLDELRERIARDSERLTPRIRDAARHALEHPKDVALNPIATVAAAAGLVLLPLISRLTGAWDPPQALRNTQH